MNSLSRHKNLARLISGVVLFCILSLSLGPAHVVTPVRAASPLQAQPSTASPGAACVPAITFTSKPPFGTEPPFTSPYENRLYGSVDCVANPADYKIAVFIYIPGWWVKPNFTNPLTPIANDGTWNTIVVTGGLDHRAIKYAAFLFPNGYIPPSVGGDATFPQELFDNAVTYLIEDRLRTIEFSGYTWNVKESNNVQVGPGGNYFSSDENDVWVDGSGNLHLTITQKDGKWHCTEVFTEASMGYGTYTFTLASPMDQLDRNAVLGLFTWDDSAEVHNYREIDIEFSKWGQDAGENSQYVVQPFDQTGNRHRFDTTLTGTYSTHSFKWETDQILFSSHQGHAPTLGSEIESWLYTGADVPSAGAGNARINLWLYDSLPPSDGQNIEVIIKAFSYPSPPIFEDVPPPYWAWEYIERLANAGVTGGCGTGIYCPENEVTRAQMAVFLERGLHYPASFTAPNVAPTFSDTVGHWAEDWIEALKNDGVTAGCAIGLYCPESPVTRAQMAVFLLKAKYGSSYTPPAVGASTGFGDVPTDHWAAAWIKQLAAEQITGGCGGGNYCPESPVTRAQMAVFLVKTFRLP